MTAEKVPEAIIFDFDGTLVDSEGATMRIAKPVLSRHLGRNVTETEMDSLRGRVWKEELATWFPETHFQVHKEIVGAWQSENPAIFPYGGIAEVVAYLGMNHVPMAIASSRLNCEIRKILDRFPWNRHFTAIVGQDDTVMHKPDPQPLLKAAEKLRIDPSKCAYVGDQPWDIRASRAAGMSSIAALWGEGSMKVLELEKPDCMLHSPDEVINIIHGRGLNGALN